MKSRPGIGALDSDCGSQVLLLVGVRKDTCLLKERKLPKVREVVNHIKVDPNILEGRRKGCCKREHLFAHDIKIVRFNFSSMLLKAHLEPASIS